MPNSMIMELFAGWNRSIVSNLSRIFQNPREMKPRPASSVVGFGPDFQATQILIVLH